MRKKCKFRKYFDGFKATLTKLVILQLHIIASDICLSHICLFKVHNYMNDEKTIIGFCLIVSQPIQLSFQLSTFILGYSLSTLPRRFIGWLFISFFYVGGVTKVGTQFWLDEYFGYLSLKGFQIIEFGHYRKSKIRLKGHHNLQTTSK